MVTAVINLCLIIVLVLGPQGVSGCRPKEKITRTTRPATTTVAVFPAAPPAGQSSEETTVNPFTASPEVKAAWKAWKERYFEEQAKEQYIAEKVKKGNADPNPNNPTNAANQPGWPSSWQGLGGGSGGAGVPPWGYVPVDRGLPAFCYKEPSLGYTCAAGKAEQRWAYNARTKECIEFPFKGCGETENNFKMKLKCVSSCMIEPIAGCNFDTDPEGLFPRC